MTVKKNKNGTGRVARRAFLLWNAAAVAGALASPLFGVPLRRLWKGTPAGREGKYYRKLGRGK